VATENFERAKAQALAGYLDPGPKHLNCAQAVTLSGLLMMDEDPARLRYQLSGRFPGGQEMSRSEPLPGVRSLDLRPFGRDPGRCSKRNLKRQEGPQRW